MIEYQFYAMERSYRHLAQWNFPAIENAYLRRSARISRTERRISDQIRPIMDAEEIVVELKEGNRLKSFGQVL